LRFLACTLPMLLLSPALLLAQSVGGNVIDALTRAPVAGVAVSVLDARGEVRGVILTEADGVFRLPLPASGSYQLRAQHQAYATTTTAALRVRRGEMIAVEIELGPQVVGLAPIVVTGRAREAPTHLNQFYDRLRRQQQLGLGRFVTRADLDNTATTNVHTVLQREHSVRLFEAGWHGMVREVVLIDRRGAPPCAPMIYIDGMQFGRSDRTELSSMVTNDEIEGIEIYSGAAETPPELADPCGVIAVWTNRAVVGGAGGNPFSLRRIAIAAGFLTLVLLSR
jgi:hypothetical protein